MNIVWFTWKDTSHPEAGGAENISSKIVKGLVKDGHEVIVITSRFPGSKKKEIRDGYKIIRVGNRYTVYWEAYRYYKKHLTDWTDEIIEEINTIPFMTQWYARKRRTLLIYQLCREIWFYQLWFPLSLIGYLIEPVYLWLLRNNRVITESESTKKDLQRFGFKEKNISIFPICIDIYPLKSIDQKKKHKQFTLLSLGTIRNMKRTLDQIKAFELAKKEIPELQLKIAGKAVGKYGKSVLKYINNSPFLKDIEYCGSVSERVKTKLLRSSNVLLVTSVKEGWGLIVTEAGSQGTPSIVYDVDGLRDAVNFGKAGYVTQENNPESLKKSIISLYKFYTKLDINKVQQWHRQFTNKKTAQILNGILFKNPYYAK